MNGPIKTEDRRLDCTQQIVRGRRVSSPLNSLLVLQQTSAPLKLYQRVCVYKALFTIRRILLGRTVKILKKKKRTSKGLQIIFPAI